VQLVVRGGGVTGSADELVVTTSCERKNISDMGSVTLSQLITGVGISVKVSIRVSLFLCLGEFILILPIL
jgi:hypothetical protein